MIAKPYVGITGFKTSDEVIKVQEQFKKNGFLNNHISYLPMFGFIVSNNRVTDITSEGHKTPALKNLAGLCELLEPNTLPMVHYYTPDNDQLFEELKKVFNINQLYERELCRSVQLNQLDGLAPIEQVEMLKEQFSDLEIVLQVPRKVLNENDSEQLASMLKPYDGFVSYVLIDPSGGEGKAIGLKHAIELLHALAQAMPITRLGVAGGLSADNVRHVISTIRKEFKEPFSFDIQALVRTVDKKGLAFNKTGKFVYESTIALTN
ncbi:hypothetical protein GOV04_00720 [Candidatus Woesearchaeota archaeon]|nr:hypothetical protein [Candidatus Woesearchaeota archaeon]